MDHSIDNLFIEEILHQRGDLLYDGKPLARHNEIFVTVKEFIIVFYGSSRDRKSREVAKAINNMLDVFNPDNQGFQKGSGEYIHLYRDLQCLWIPCEKNFMEFQSMYNDNYEYGWIYPNYPQDQESYEESKCIFGST